MSKKNGLHIDGFGTKHWYKNGKLHREDGPSVIYTNGDKRWYINDKLHRDNDLPAREFENGTKHWYKDGDYHRENGPAVIYFDGNKKWYRNGHYLTEGEFKKWYRENRLNKILDD